MNNNNNNNNGNIPQRTPSSPLQQQQQKGVMMMIKTDPRKVSEKISEEYATNEEEDKEFEVEEEGKIPKYESPSNSQYNLKQPRNSL